MGVMIPWAPASRARLIIHSSAQGTRMMGLAFSEPTALTSYFISSLIPMKASAKIANVQANLVVVLVRNQSMLRIHQHPAELC